MIRIAVSGASGRMGHAIARLAAESRDIVLVGGMERGGRRGGGIPGYGTLTTPETADEIIEDADVVLDFSAPEFLLRLLDTQWDTLAGRGLVVGTTGLDDEVLRRLDELAKQSAVLVSANFSIGVNVLLALVEDAARMLPADHYDVEIVETHHRGKADAPSGTALALGRAVASGRGARLEELRRDGRTGRIGERPTGEIGFHALRGGGVAGEHQVHFLGNRERLELNHSAADRSVFAEGAILAANWIAGKPPGHYTMRQVLGG